MKFDYAQAMTASPAGVVVQYRPLIPVRIRGPGKWSYPLAGILSSGSDITVFLEEDARDIGIDLTGLPEEQGLTDTSLAIPYRRAPVTVRITDASGETCEWQTAVGFTTFPLLWPLLGHTGFLEFFTASLLGEPHQVVLDPNATFPGQHFLPPHP